jgi:hypothetical protein
MQIKFCRSCPHHIKGSAGLLESIKASATDFSFLSIGYIYNAQLKQMHTEDSSI